MNRAMLFLGVTLLAATAAGTVACNGLLGIGSATVGETPEGGPSVEAGVTCPYYCQVITQNCSGQNAEYQGDLGLCLSMCNNLSLDFGSITNSNDNTLGCRIYYAQLAGTADNGPNCRAAGPLGGGVCGDGTSACSNFCSLGVPYCAGIGKPSYASVDQCNVECLGGDAGPEAGPGFVFTTDGGSTGTDLPEGTNTLNCRYYHLENAYPTKMRGSVHCPHTEPVSATCN